MRQAQQEWSKGTRAIQFQVPGLRTGTVNGHDALALKWGGERARSTVRISARWMVGGELHQMMRSEVGTRSRGRNTRRYMFSCSCKWNGGPSRGATADARWHLDEIVDAQADADAVLEEQEQGHSRAVLASLFVRLD